MTETVPERVWLYEGPDGRDWTECLVFGQPSYVPATALEAAQARIAELEARLREAADLVNILVKEAVTARREALEGAANTERECPTHVTDAYRLGWSDAMKIRTERIHALMEKPNG